LLKIFLKCVILITSYQETIFFALNCVVVFLAWRI